MPYLTLRRQEGEVTSKFKDLPNIVPDPQSFLHYAMSNPKEG